MKKEIDTKLGITILVVITIITALFLKSVFDYFSIHTISFSSISLPDFSSIFKSTSESEEKIEKFSSEEEFKAYLQAVEEMYSAAFGIGGGARDSAFEEIALEAPSAEKGVLEQTGMVPERVSETTVQVMGIDEPDIVKTDGKEIYFSSLSSYYRGEFIMEFIPPKSFGETKAVKAFPPDDLKVDSKIDKRGDLLLYNNVLTIFSGDKIYGYDVSDPKNPQKKWTIELKNNNYLVAARLYNDKIYLVTRTQINTYHPCPIIPFAVEGDDLEIKCVDIYHPAVKIPVDVTYNAVIFDPVSGKTENKVSFVGTSNQSVVYMSENALYISYYYYESVIDFFAGFYKEKCSDIIPDWFLQKVQKLKDYDISETAKMTEFQIILQGFFNSLDNDERLRIENEIENRIQDYYKEHKRDLEKTGIVKIGIDDFEVKANGMVPGKPLNQFSMDEYRDYLRIAVTVGEGWFGWGFGMGFNRESANDVYVLDKNLQITGSVKDLGLEERIYSARFIQDKGYLVTFRQIDPFFVLDLSDPKKPEVKGELKIPGYSSYLHPITKDKILGIGKEGSNVKISLFDVKDPESPAEKDKYSLSEYWSDILNTHHAFLLDSKHEIFFLPGSRGGYVFSYKNDLLKMEKAVSGIAARRAIYINDYLYIIGDNEIVVLNETDWQRVGGLEF